MKNNTIMRGLAALALFTCVSSCQDEEFGYTFEDVRKGQYSRVFDDKFGKPDPNHTWSMAKHFIATASLNIEGDAQLSIYSSDPRRTVGSKLLGLFDLQNGQMSSAFTASSALDNAFILVKQDGKIAFEGYCSVQDSLLQISEITRAKKAETRATQGNYSIGTKLFTHTAYHDTDYDWDGETFCVNGAYFMKYTNGTYYLSSDGVNGPFFEVKHIFNNSNPYYQYWEWRCDEVTLKNGMTVTNLMENSFQKNSDGSPIYTPSTQWGNQGARKVETRVHWDAPYYQISGNTYAGTVEWTIGDCKDLFWSDEPYAFFRESVDYRSSQKKALYESQGVSLSQIEQGVVYTTRTSGPIAIPMMFGATQNNNIFGYYYYTGSQDPRTVNRYVLFDDASPSANIQVDGKSVGGMDLQQMQDGWTDNSIVTCQSRYLVYFGENGNEAGSTEFPADVKIGFFIMRKHNDYSSLNGATCEDGWAYSDPDLCGRYFNNDRGWNTTLADNWSYKISTGKDSDLGRGKVKALTWKYGDRILVGFGDQGGDNDLNDFVFWVDGNFQEEPPITITTEEKEHNSWLFACEDLGGTFDYDFNDVVWDVYQEYTKTIEITKNKKGKETKTEVIKYDDIKVRLLAAGGILPLHIMYDGKDLGEVHQCYGQSEANEYSQVNVGNKVERKPIVLETISANNKEMDLNTIKNKLKVQVRGQEVNSYFIDFYFKDTHYILTDNNPSRTNRPQILTLDGDWEWPQEGKPIDTVYPNFRSWVASALFGKWDEKKEGLYTSRDL